MASFSASRITPVAIKFNVWAAQRWCGGNEKLNVFSIFKLSSTSEISIGLGFSSSSKSAFSCILSPLSLLNTLINVFFIKIHLNIEI